MERLAPVRHDSIDDIPDPSENISLVGHQEIRSLLAQAYRQGKLAHALLLAGPRGIGKATLAFHLANYLLSNPDPSRAPATIPHPDPASRDFRGVAQQAHPSVLYLTRPANDRTKGFKTALTVDEVRRVARFLSMRSHDGGYRVIIVDPADDMNVSAANALLKSLEEPPSRTVFILISHLPGRLLPTIRSRCQLMRLEPLTDEQLFTALQALGVELPTDAGEREAIASRAGGSVRAALMLTHYGGLEIAQAIDQALDAPRLDVEHLSRLADAVTQRDSPLQYQIFNDHLLETLARRARDAAAQGVTSRAEGLAATWSMVRTAAGETDTYNLDKRQYVQGTLIEVRERLLSAV